MRITICGLAGTGTSTVGKSLSTVLGYEFVSSGGIFRAKADELGMDLNEFEELCKQDKRYDMAVDERIAEIGKTQDNIVVESRLAWYFIPDSIKVLLTCDFDIRVSRVADRDNLTREEAEEKTRHREEAIRGRFREYYGIETFDSPDNFDLIIDTGTIGVDEIVDRIVAHISS